MEALNLGYGAGLSLFTEAEILAHRGIAYGGSDTLAGQIGPYADYIVLPQGVFVPAVPGLSPGALFVCALTLAGIGIGGLLPRLRRSA